MSKAVTEKISEGGSNIFLNKDTEHSLFFWLTNSMSVAGQLFTNQDI